MSSLSGMSLHHRCFLDVPSSRYGRTRCWSRRLTGGSNRMVAAAARGFCVALFWLLALAINRIVPNSAIDPVAGVVAGVLVAIPVYRAVRRGSW
jgi:hypothetical protein